jgi:hypothetical protein
MKVHIVNDGELAYMTQILDAETGQMVSLAKRVIIDFDVDKPIARAILYTQSGDKELLERYRLHGSVKYPKVDVIADAEIKHVCPCCGQPVEKPQ